MRVLVGCEESGAVRDAFIRAGHEAVSCDLQPTRVPGPHFQGNVLDILGQQWDMAILHPPCTHTAVSGAKHFAEKRADGRQQASLAFIADLIDRSEHIARVAIEQPVSILSTVWRRPDQIIQPWQYGHGETKTTCLWLRGLPLLVPTNIVAGRADRIHKMPPSPERARLRSQTYAGIAAAMANQWGGTL